MNCWTEKEIGILKTFYVTGGCKAVMKHLQRSKKSIQNMANRLSITADKSIYSEAAKEHHAKYDQHGENNPNWKNGISGNNLHYKKLQIERYPEKVHARELLEYAVRHGKIKRLPCEVCGKIKSEAHHDDYSKPYDVHWLCRKHHNEIHKRMEKEMTA
jgi:hypothetical protein